MVDVTMEQRLRALGGALEFPRADSLVDDVVSALDASAAASRSTWRRPLLAVAAALVVIVAATLAVPDARSAVARWLGFDGYRIERVVDLPDVGGAPPPGGPLVEVITGELDAGAFGKLVDAGVDVDRVEVDGRTAYWISGQPHVFFYLDDGRFEEQRLAGNTLVWQRGPDIVRVEGADLTLAEALEIARGLDEP